MLFLPRLPTKQYKPIIIFSYFMVIKLMNYGHGLINHLKIRRLVLINLLLKYKDRWKSKDGTIVKTSPFSQKNYFLNYMNQIFGPRPPR